jgi:hypothetical protein
MTRNLGALPWTEVGIELAAKFEHFPLQALDFFLALVGGGEAAKLFDVFFQTIDFALAVERGDCGDLFIFLSGAHYATL